MFGACTTASVHCVVLLHACRRSLVKKDVAMLDAFGKGADEDMRRAKVRGTDDSHMHA